MNNSNSAQLLKITTHSNSLGTPQIILKGLSPLLWYWCFSLGLTRAKSPAFRG
jgi:hypothetical protein